MNNDKPKDVLVPFNNAKRSTKDGKLRVELAMTDERAMMLIEELTKLLGSPRGKEGKNSIKMDIHVKEKEYEGRKFDSGFAFVRNVHDFGAGPMSNSGNKLKAKASSDFNVEAKIAQLKAAAAASTAAAVSPKKE